MNRNLAELGQLIRADCFRYIERCRLGDVFRLARTNPGFRYTVVLRLATFVERRKHFLAFLTRALHRHYSIKYGIQIPLSADIGAGLLLPHFGGIVVNSKAAMGKNCTILHGVTIGSVAHGSRAGNPILGDGVYLGPGATVVGKVRVGDGAVLSAGTWVNFDVPEDSLVIGNPGKVVKNYDSERSTRVKNWAHEATSTVSLPNHPRC